MNPNDNPAEGRVELSRLFRVDGQVALVTGAGRGIGAAIAQLLAQSGAQVVLVSRTAGELQEIAGRIEAAGSRAHVRVCDVTDSVAVRSLIETLPQLDIVVNNAGTNIPEPFLEVSDEHLDALIDLNTRAVFVVAQAGVRKMLQHPARLSRGGAVINISSQMGHIGSPNRTVYCMTKHAVEGLTKAMAVELAPDGIRANAVAPGMVDTELLVGKIDEAGKRAVAQSTPLGRLATPLDIANACLFLASDLSAYVTGVVLDVSGGLHIH